MYSFLFKVFPTSKFFDDNVEFKSNVKKICGKHKERKEFRQQCKWNKSDFNVNRLTLNENMVLHMYIFSETLFSITLDTFEWFWVCYDIEHPES